MGEWVCTGRKIKLSAPGTQHELLVVCVSLYCLWAAIFSSSLFTRFVVIITTSVSCLRSYRLARVLKYGLLAKAAHGASMVMGSWRLRFVLLCAAAAGPWAVRLRADGGMADDGGCLLPRNGKTATPAKPVPWQGQRQGDIPIFR